MWDKVRKRIVDACDVMDMVMAAVVVIGIVIAVIGIFPQIGELWRHREEMVAFLEFLDAVLGVVIGVEFLKMLCKPNTANIIEALIFVIARHMIVQTTTAGEDLVSVISICMLFLFRRFMLATKPDKEHHVPNIFKAIKIAQSPEFQEAFKLPVGAEQENRLRILAERFAALQRVHDDAGINDSSHIRFSLSSFASSNVTSAGRIPNRDLAMSTLS